MYFKIVKKYCFFILLLIVFLANINFHKYKSIDYNKITSIILDNTFNNISNLENIKERFVILNKNKLNYLNSNLRHKVSVNKIVSHTIDINKNNLKPIVYLYNSHQTESYSNTLSEYTIKPTVTIVNYILEEVFLNNNIKSYVEEDSIKNILHNHGWNYAYSYKASRILMEKRKKEFPTLIYFIDIHRDSLSKNRTTVKINDKSYAKLLFILGLENKNYKRNEVFINKINSKLNDKYPGLSKGVYKKIGPHVNGVYNQDFSENTILIEVGGVDNSPIEVLNSSLAFAECFIEAIK